MTTYFVSFRIADKGDYAKVYENLHEQVQLLAGGSPWWFETTSFYIFKSEESADRIAAALKAVIRPATDLIFLGSLTHKAGRVIGKCDDQDIFKLADFIKKF